MYKEWADGQVNKIRGILNAARSDHTEAVKARIDSVQQLGGVVDITKTLFEVSKVRKDATPSFRVANKDQETAQLEAKAYELEQRTALAAEAKTVLDSWVRYEGQVKIRQQKELAESIISKIQKELENPKVLQQILQQSVADVESKQCLLILRQVRANNKQGSCNQRPHKWDKTEEQYRFPMSTLLSINLLCNSQSSIFHPCTLRQVISVICLVSFGELTNPMSLWQRCQLS